MNLHCSSTRSMIQHMCFKSFLVFSLNFVLLLHLSAVCAEQTSERESKGKSQTTASFPVLASGDNSPAGTG